MQCSAVVMYSGVTHAFRVSSVSSEYGIKMPRGFRINEDDNGEEPDEYLKRGIFVKRQFNACCSCVFYLQL